MADAIYQLLMKNEYDHVATSQSSSAKGLIPDGLLVDITTLRQDLLIAAKEEGGLLCT